MRYGVCKQAGLAGPDQLITGRSRGSAPVRKSTHHIFAESRSRVPHAASEKNRDPPRPERQRM